MKTLNPVLSTLMVTSIIPVLVVVVGCHDPSISQTAPEEKSEAVTCERLQPTDNIMPLEGVLKAPGRTPNAFISIKGLVSYSFQSTTYRDRHRVDIELSTNGTLAPDETGKTLWSVTGKSHDELFVSEEGMAVLEKRFKVEGAPGQLRLALKFLISSNGIGLSAMWLERIDEPLAEQKTG